MKVVEAVKQIRELMDAHGLNSWRIELSSARNTLGSTRGSAKLLKFSRPFLELNEWDPHIKDVALHEIAHALAWLMHYPKRIDAHGPEWKAIARDIGAKPQSMNRGAVLPRPRYEAECTKCHRVHGRTKSPGTFYYRCGACKMSAPVLVWTDNRTGRTVR
jgi:predicted SprT family Zn-dependent metalloprotease